MLRPSAADDGRERLGVVRLAKGGIDGAVGTDTLAARDAEGAQGLSVGGADRARGRRRSDGGREGRDGRRSDVGGEQSTEALHTLHNDDESASGCHGPESTCHVTLQHSGHSRGLHGVDLVPGQSVTIIH